MNALYKKPGRKRAACLAVLAAAALNFSARGSLYTFDDSGPIPNNGTTFSVEQTISGEPNLISSVILTLTFNDNYDLGGNIQGSLTLNPSGSDAYITFTPSATSSSSYGQEIYTVDFSGPTSFLFQNPNGVWALNLWDTGSSGIENGLVNWSLGISGSTPVPEPITCALPLFGLIFLAGEAARRYLARRRKAKP